MVEETVKRVMEEIQKRESKKVTLQTAKVLAQKVETYAKGKGKSVVIAVANKDGNPVCVHAMDDAFLISFELAVKKAYTSAALKMTTEELATLTAEGASLHGLENMVGQKIIALGGGAPLVCNGQVVGAIGVSGGSVEEDNGFARYAQTVWKGV